MAMKRCPDCGEKYSDTYKYCPFCEEAEILREDRSRRRGRRVAGRRKFSLLTPTLVVLILIMAGLLVYLLWGEQLKTRFAGGDKPGTEVVTPTQPEEPVPEEPVPEEPVPEDPGVMPEEPTVEPEEPVAEPETPPAGKTDYASAAKLPDGLTLSKTDYTAYSGDPVVRLTVTGGSGTYTWLSQNESLAKVDADGRVTAIAAGTVTILATDGSSKGICIVRVKGPSAVSATPAAPATPAPSTGDDNGSGGAHALNREDFTLSVGEKFQLKVSGITTALTWSTGNSKVATISSNGTVTAVGRGTTNATVSWDGQSLSCIVRVM